MPSATSRFIDRVATVEKEPRARPLGPRRGGRQVALQADGLQGRVRGRAPLHRRRVPEEARRRSSRATTSSPSISRRRCSPIAIPTTGQLKKREYGAWMMPAVPLPRLAEEAARHGARRLRLHRGAQDGAPPDRRVRGHDRQRAGDARPEQPRDGGADRRRARDHARLRPRQGKEREGRQGARSLAARRLPRAGDGEKAAAE